jgi:hypothetical protein
MVCGALLGVANRRAGAGARSGACHQGALPLAHPGAVTGALRFNRAVQTGGSVGGGDNKILCASIACTKC